jgi:hypothetical protein
MKALLLKEVDSRCPFCKNDDVDHFQFHHIDGNRANTIFENLLAVCPNCHSKITKSDISLDEVLEVKFKLQETKTKEAKPKMGKVINFKSKVNTAIIGDNNTTIVNNINKPQKKLKYPEGCVGYDNLKANYIGYLKDKYHQYKEKDVGKEAMNYAIFPSKIKKHFKIGATRTIYNIPITRFGELVEFIQSEINGTKQGRINRARGYQSYDLLEEYLQKYS